MQASKHEKFLAPDALNAIIKEGSIEDKSMLLVFAIEAKNCPAIIQLLKNGADLQFKLPHDVIPLEKVHEVNDPRVYEAIKSCCSTQIALQIEAEKKILDAMMRRNEAKLSETSFVSQMHTLVPSSIPSKPAPKKRAPSMPAPKPPSTQPKKSPPSHAAPKPLSKTPTKNNPVSKPYAPGERKLPPIPPTSPRSSSGYAPN